MNKKGKSTPIKIDSSMQKTLQLMKNENDYLEEELIYE